MNKDGIAITASGVRKNSGMPKSVLKAALLWDERNAVV